MVPPISQDDFGPFDDTLQKFDYGAEFDFGREFTIVGFWNFGSFEYEGVSIYYSEDGTNQHRRHCSHHCWQWNNQMYHTKSVKNFCWYHEFLQ